MSGTTYDWDQVWSSVGRSLALDEHGFHHGALDAARAVEGGNFVGSLADAQGCACLLLTGASGVGKSTALRREEARLRRARQDVVLVDLRRLMAPPDDDLRRAFAPVFEAAGVVTVLVDALDEALPRIDAVDARVLRLLVEARKASGGRLRARVAVRSGVVVGEFAAGLRELFVDGFAELTLAPLGTGDVRVAAEAEGLDGTEFLEEVRALRAGPLAARPVTLAMLLDLRRQGLPLPVRRTALYEQGCALLARERDPGRLKRGGGEDARAVGRLDGPARLAVASRLAALMTLCAKPVLDLGVDARGGDSVLTCEDVVGAESIDGAEIRVTRAALMELVRTGLFEPLGGERHGFAHRSYTEYLAARFLVGRGLGRAQMVSLLRGQAETGGTIDGSGLAEVASWAGALDRGVFDALVDEDPAVLLRSGVPASDLADRERLAAALLRGARAAASTSSGSAARAISCSCGTRASPSSSAPL